MALIGRAVRGQGGLGKRLPAAKRKELAAVSGNRGGRNFVKGPVRPAAFWGEQRAVIDKEKAETEKGHPSKGVPLSDRKSTRLNSSHVKISYAVFCLKKK